MKTLPVSSRPTKTSRTESHMIATTAATMIVEITSGCVWMNCVSFMYAPKKSSLRRRNRSNLELLASERFDDALALQESPKGLR